MASKAEEGKAAGGAEEGKTSSSSSSAPVVSASPSVGLVAKVESYFYQNDDFANLFENFANEHASMIDLKADETEFKLEYTDVYKKFTTLFETTLSAFIRRQGHEIEDFYEEVRQGFEADEEGDVAQFAKIMMATCDFDIFMMLMREAAQGIAEKKARGDFSSKNEVGDSI